MMIICSSDLVANSESVTFEYANSGIKHSDDNDADKQVEFLMKLSGQLRKGFDNQQLKIQHIAKSIAISERQLYRHSKSYLNDTPVGYLRRYRLQKALVKMREGEALGNISYEVGFSSHSYFSRCFKQTFGNSPSVFVEQLKQFNEESFK